MAFLYDDWAEFQRQPQPDLPGLPHFREDRWLRMQAGLFLLSNSGLSVVQELAQELASFLGAPSSSGSLQRIYRSYLKEAGLVDYQVLPLFQTGLAVARLSLEGKLLCSLLGYPVVETEWERLLRLHAAARQTRHTAMVLAFTREARLRGYHAVVVPPVGACKIDTRPDVLLVKQSETVYVEVERRRQKHPKWLNLDAVQGFVALCTPTPRTRATIRREIMELGIPGQATDLDTLRKRSLLGIAGPLWLEEW